MSQQSTFQSFSDNSLVVTFSTIDIEAAENVIRSCYAAGVRVFEFSHLQNASATIIGVINVRLKDLSKLVMGITEVLTESDAEAYIEAGASFISSPCFVDAVSDECYQNKIAYIPGCMTLKEVHTAVQAGCEAIKIFPAETLSYSFVNAVKTIFPKVKCIISGVVLPLEKTYKTWLASGATSICVGLSIIKSEWIEAKNYVRIEKAVSEVINSLR
ncbi:MAG TPA: hypothetical protein VF623_05505 [Segetibacter sp.]